MIVTKRHTKEDLLNDDERIELIKIKNGYISENYDFIIEATTRIKSIPSHFHQHLIVVRQTDE